MPTDPTGVMGISSATTPVTSTSGAVSGPERDQACIKKAAQDFEAVFVGMMLKQMRKSMTGGTPLFGGSSQAKMYQDMMDDMTAQHLSKNSPFGLAKTLERSLLARQGHPVTATSGVESQSKTESQSTTDNAAKASALTAIHPDKNQ